MKLNKFLYYISHWESWHWFAKYILIAPAWAFLCLRSRTLWFFTPSNPDITFGGFGGETKQEVYSKLPPDTFPNSIYIKPSMSVTSIVRMMDQAGLTFPVAVKPDSGLMGFMFRKLENLDHLKQYHAAMRVDYVLQEYITYPLEISVFYYRYPQQQKGNITGFVKKELLEVTGDGKKTLLELILNYPRVQFRLDEMKAKHASRLHEVIEEGAHYCLSHALNLSRGGKLISLAREKDERLMKVFDDLSHYCNFYYGRYDIRCTSIEDLKAGRNFSILEFNGCGAEPHHVYGDGNTLWKACRILVKHWNIMSKISVIHHRAGVPYWPHRKALLFYKSVRQHMKELKKLDQEFEFDKKAHETSAVSSEISGFYQTLIAKE